MAEAAQVIPLPTKHKILEARLVRADYGNTLWRAAIPVGVPYDTILTPEFWVHVAGPKNMLPGDEIRIIPDDGSYVALLFVRDAGASWGAKVSEIYKKDFDTPAIEKGYDIPPGYRIEWRGLSEKHVVVRESDGTAVVSGKKTRPDAVIALIEHVKNS